MSTLTVFPDGSRAHSDSGLIIRYAADGTPRGARLQLSPNVPATDNPYPLDQSVPSDSAHHDYHAARDRRDAWMIVLFTPVPGPTLLESPANPVKRRGRPRKAKNPLKEMVQRAAL